MALHFALLRGGADENSRLSTAGDLTGKIKKMTPGLTEVTTKWSRSDALRREVSEAGTLYVEQLGAGLKRDPNENVFQSQRRKRRG